MRKPTVAPVAKVPKSVAPQIRPVMVARKPPPVVASRAKK